MTERIPSDFQCHEDWLAHVGGEIPLPEQPLIMAIGRLELFRNFCRMQGLPFPTQFAQELERIGTLPHSGQRVALEALNDGIFRSLIVHLINRKQPATSLDELQTTELPREQIGELRSHLAHNNRHYALWIAYKSGVSDRSVAEEWEDYLVQELGSQHVEEADFARAMVELDRLLTRFRRDDRPLPRLAFERIWFLHHIRGPERMAQTRAILGTLMAEFEVCTSA